MAPSLCVNKQLNKLFLFQGTSLTNVVIINQASFSSY
jgi:hypothetical protein